jgi:hypothetical protein
MSLYLFHSIWTLIGNRRLQLPKMLCPAWFILSSPKVIVPAALFTTDSIPCLFCAVRHEIPTTKLLGFMGHSEGQTPQLAPGWSGLCLYKSLGLREWYWTVLGLHLVFDPLEKKNAKPKNHKHVSPNCRDQTKIPWSFYPAKRTSQVLRKIIETSSGCCIAGFVYQEITPARGYC